MKEVSLLTLKIENLEQRVSKLESLLERSVELPSHKKKLSIKEFLLSIKPVNDVQKTLAIGYYLEKYQGVTSFNIDDIGNYFRLAKESSPKNMNDKINMNIKKGHIMEVKEKKGNKKAWEITSRGEKFVEEDFK